MNIGIDGYEANTDERVGIGQYAYQVLKYLSKLDNQNNYTVFLPTPALIDMPVISQHWNYVVGTPASFWTIKQLPALIKTKTLDLFFSPTHYIPWFTQVPRVFSIMDLSYLHFPRMFATKDYMQLKYMTLYSIKHARKIFTISEFSKREITKHYKFPAEHISVTYPGINLEFRNQTSGNITENLKRYNINKRYILFVGTLQPRKNIQRLVEAFNLLREDMQLVLVGKKGWLFEPILETIEKSPQKDNILVPDFISDSDLAILYKHAQCFALPSLYEGFGIPVIEALYYGCPVVVSNTSSLPEIAGDGGIYINPLETEDIAQGLRKALQLKPAQRRELVKKGQAHIKQFNWEECTKKTLEVLNNFDVSG